MLSPDTTPSATRTLETATFAIPQAVVTGQYGLRHDAAAVQAVQVLDRRAIDRVAAVTLRDLLATSSSVTLGYDGQIGSSIRLLGLSGQHVQVLVDGVPVIGRLDGNIDIDQLPLDAVERVEVVEGPMSVEYGSEAIAGTINLITRKGGTTSAAELRTTAESAGRYTASGLFTAPFASGARLQGRLSRLYFDGLNPAGVEGRELLWKPKEQISSALTYGRDFGGLTWSVGGEAMWETLWNDGPVEYVTETVPLNDSLVGVYRVPIARDGVFTTQRTVLRTDLAGELGGGRVDGFAAMTRYRRERATFSRNLVDLSREPLVAEGMNDTAVFRMWQSRVAYHRPLGERVEGSIGYDLSREEALGSRVGGGLRTMHNAAVFGSCEWRPHAEWTLRPGLRVLYNNVFRAPLVPSLHAKWARGPHAVRASYARGFRAPELKELYFEFVDFNHNLRGNTALRSEVSNSFQASYTLRWLTDRAFSSPTLKLFHNEVTDLIDLALVDQETTSYMYINVGKVRTTGVSAGFDRTGERLTLRTQVTAVERNVAIDPSADSPERNRSLQVAAGCDVRLPREVVVTFQTNYAHNETLLAPDGNGGWAQATLSPLTLLSLYVARSWADGRVNATAGADNLLNTTFRTLSGETVGTGGLHSAATGSQPVSLGRNFRFTLYFPFG